MRVRLLPILLLVTVVAACLESPDLPPTDTNPPIVWIVAPLDSAMIASPDTIRIAADDDVGVTRVAAYADGDSLGMDESAPYSILVDGSRGAADTLVLWARAWDQAGNSSVSDSIRVFVLPPENPHLRIIRPEEGDTVSGTISVEISVAEPDTVFFVSISMDDTWLGSASAPDWTLELDTDPWSDGGLHTLVAEGFSTSWIAMQSPPIHIRVRPGILARPTLLLPRQDDIHLPAATSFRWSTVPGTDGYEIELAADIAFSHTLFTSTLPDTLHIYEDDAVGWRFVRVRASFPEFGWGNWSLTLRYHQGSPFEDGVCVLHEVSGAEHATWDGDGGLLVCGHLGDDGLLLRLDPSGSPTLFRTYPMDGDAVLARIAARPGGGWVMAGKPTSSAASGMVLDVDVEGNELGRRSYAKIEPAPLGLISLGSDLIALALNHSYDFSTSLIGLQANGSSLWAVDHEGYSDYGHTWGFEWRHLTSGLLRRIDGTLIYLGTSTESWWDDGVDGGSRTSSWLQAVDPADGQIVTELRVDSTSISTPCTTAGGEIAAVGWSSDSGLKLFRFPEDLQSSTSVSIGPDRWGSRRALVELAGGDFVLAGTRDGDAYLIRFTPGGTIVWERTLGDPVLGDEFNDVQVTPSGEIIAIGRTRVEAGLGGKLWVKRFDAAGIELE